MDYFRKNKLHLKELYEVKDKISKEINLISKVFEKSLYESIINHTDFSEIIWYLETPNLILSNFSIPDSLQLHIQDLNDEIYDCGIDNFYYFEISKNRLIIRFNKLSEIFGFIKKYKCKIVCESLDDHYAELNKSIKELKDNLKQIDDIKEFILK